MLRNIYSREEPASSIHFSTLENYYKIFDKFLIVIIWLESTLNNNLAFDEIAEDELIDFLKEKLVDCEIFEDRG